MARQFPDKRTGQNTIYRIEDVALGAFSVFFTQSPSFLAHQTAMAETKSKNNAHTLFGIQHIPTDNHIRDLLDAVPPQRVFPMFDWVIKALDELGQLQAFHVLDDQLLIALDGTQYHSSHIIHCDHCSVKHHRNGNTSYSHTVVTPVIVSPLLRRILPLAPEFVTPQDGHKKQDCETAAAKRWIDRQSEFCWGRKVTLLGDDLYSRQPLCGRYHYLGHATAYGASVRYLIETSDQPSSPQRTLGCMQFSSPAWQMKARDHWIGWDHATRLQQLPRLINNSRFLILPWVRIPSLASHVLSLALRTATNDWEALYGVHPWLVETLVDSSRYSGHCYRAANWIDVGLNTGRGRQDRAHQRHGASPKKILLYPLCRNVRSRLQACHKQTSTEENNGRMIDP